MNFTVYGDPMPQPRPRFARMGRFVKTYDPKEAVDAKRRIAVKAKESGVFLIDGPVAIHIGVFIKRPQKMGVSAQNKGVVRHTKRGDCDNYAKLVLDALIGIAYKDDGQVCDLHVQKFYHDVEGQPRTEIMIEELS